jgi:ubiquinone/menaquinone biosynthesis C-methylase UbiE
MSDEAMLRPDEVRADYNQTVQDVQGEYVRFRWLSSPTKRRHYAQTRASLLWASQWSQPGRLLEVGCGPAVWTEIFLPRARSATLLDISDEMLDGARRALDGRPGLSFVRADFTEATLDPAAYDTVVSVRAFEYMPDKPATLARFAAVLRPGGRFVLVTKNAGWRDHREAQKSVQQRDPDSIPRNVRLQAGVVEWRNLESMARDAGFREVSVHPVVIGSYTGPAQTWPALALFDVIHRMTYRGPMRSALDPWTESVLLLGTR